MASGRVDLAGRVAQQATAGSLSWLDEVVRRVHPRIGRGRPPHGPETKAALGRQAVRPRGRGKPLRPRPPLRRRRPHGPPREEPAEAALKLRFQRLIKPDPAMAKTFDALAPLEKRLVVEIGEAAQTLARRYPGQAETMVRRLGVEGLSAVRAYGDDVAEVIVKEGPDRSTSSAAPAAAAGSSSMKKSCPQGQTDRRRRLHRVPRQPRAVRRHRRPGHSVRRRTVTAPASSSPEPSAEAPLGAWNVPSAVLDSIGLNHPVLRWFLMGGTALIALVSARRPRLPDANDSSTAHLAVSEAAIGKLRNVLTITNVMTTFVLVRDSIPFGCFILSLARVFIGPF